VRVGDTRAQTTAEYTALLALVSAVLLAGAGAIAGPGEIGAAVAAGLRTGICIVGGDVCRASDARAAGLEPCTVGERHDGGGATVSVAWLRLGGRGGTTVATRSDGSVLVTRTAEGSAGAGLGVGIEASPLGVAIGVDGSIDFTVARGEAWEFADAAAARRFLAGEDVPPTWRFGEAGEALTGGADMTVGGSTLAGVEASARTAEGARVGRGRTTLYTRTRLGSALELPGGSGVGGPTSGDVMTEVTLVGDEPREIAFRTVGRSAGGGRVADTVARLDLRDPAMRAAADAAPDLPSLIRLAVQRGVVERAVYDVRDDSRELELAVRIGAQLGVDASQVRVQRRLVSASAWTRGSQERVREDCLL
jgi:hypothetical protein